MFYTSISHANENFTVRHYQHQERYAFGLELLELAFSKLDETYQIQNPYQQANKEINEARGEAEVISGALDLEFMSTTASREKAMIPIKVPIYRGIIGLRLILATPSRAAKLSKMKELDDLRSFTGGHGTHWGDVGVYDANDLGVITNVHYESLFKMLIEGRFDYFHRGVNEVWEELGRYSEKLIVVDNVMLYYPHPVYYFVSKYRPSLAHSLARGLKMAMEDGSYKQLFLKYHQVEIRKANFGRRNLIVLNNPVVPEGTAEIDTSWWLPRSIK